ncbi:MAG: hypothetical protein AAFO04_25370 [Cyanobacteria bacterium J06592_8]
MADKFIDFSKEREKNLTPFNEVIDVSSLSFFYDKIYTVFTACVSLPHSEIQIPLILAYICTPSAMSNRLPICFFQGKSGSGKSKAGMFANNLYGVDILQESATTASIRNELNNRKFILHPEDGATQLEQNTILVWDDLRPVRISPTSPDSIFGMLKSGCSRQTSQSKIALPGGKTQEFCTFGLKVISSISPIWAYPGCEELIRRSMPFRFEKVVSSDVEFIDIETIEIFELSLQLKNFWFDTSILNEYQAIRKTITHMKSEHKEFKTFCVDILTTLSIISEIPLKEVIQLFNEYCSTVREPMLNNTIVDEILDTWLLDKKESLKEENAEFVEQGLEEFVQEKLEIPSVQVYKFLKSRINDGSIDLQRIDNPYIHELMIKQGFTSKITKHGLIWQET